MIATLFCSLFPVAMESDWPKLSTKDFHQMKQGTRRSSERGVRPLAEKNSASMRKEIVPIREQIGLNYETIVRSFSSIHVMNFCETLCNKAWLDANSELEKLLETVAEIQEGKPDEISPTLKDDNTAKLESLFQKRLATLKAQMRPRCEESFAAVVMADVSGYSNLSSTLSEKGAEGAEILSKTMKGYLDKVSFRYDLMLDYWYYLGSWRRYC